MSKHHITHAAEVYHGSALYYPLKNANGRVGAPVTFLTKLDMGSPVVPDADGHVATQDMSAETTYTLDGALAGTHDVARGVQIVAGSIGDTTQVCTVTGTDAYGEDLVENITYNGTTVVFGKKAFLTITGAVNDGNLTSTGSIGSSDVLGLPYRAVTKSDVLHTWFNDVEETTLPTVVAGVSTAATATTGDVRGTIDLNSASDGSQIYVYMNIDSSTKDLMAGVSQYGG